MLPAPQFLASEMGPTRLPPSTVWALARQERASLHRVRPKASPESTPWFLPEHVGVQQGLLGCLILNHHPLRLARRETEQDGSSDVCGSQDAWSADAWPVTWGERTQAPPGIRCQEALHVQENAFESSDPARVLPR